MRNLVNKIPYVHIFIKCRFDIRKRIGHSKVFYKHVCLESGILSTSGVFTDFGRILIP